MNARVYVPLNQLKNWEMFSEDYHIYEILLATGKREYSLKEKSKRVCRFCNRMSEETSFKNEAHIIRQALGNKNYISDFECDECNDKYSLYDQHLCNYFGMQRTFFDVKGKKGVPNYKSGGINLKSFGPKAKMLSREDINDQTIFHNNKEKEIVIQNLKPKYIPLYVFKALLKIGLSLLYEDIKNYEFAIKYLNNPSFSSKFKKIPLIFFQQTDLGYDFPFAILFEKKHPESRIPTHIFRLHSLGMFLQIVLPFHKKDSFMFKPEGVEVTFSPPLIFSKPNVNYNLLNSYFEDFSDNTLRSEMEKLTLKMLEEPNACYDFKTKKIIQLERK